MTNDKQIQEMIETLQQKLAANRVSDNGTWRSTLSSSAISTSVSVFALYMADAEKHNATIENGQAWLYQTMLPNGTWGDSPESPANMTATLLSYAALFATGKPSAKTKAYIDQALGGSTDEKIINGVLKYYGKDLTFSAPILIMCALAGVIKEWDKIPQLPFELAILPQGVFRFLQLPVVSYAIPALIAVGILRHKMGRKNVLSPVRDLFIPKSMKVLQRHQPVNGGFLEAAPLTAFVTMCLCGAGFREHLSTHKAVDFLVDTVREDGSWPIDTNLDSWATALSVRALGNNLENKVLLAEKIRKQAFQYKHPFTGAEPGGWGWTNRPGAVPDADDTAGALVALHILLDGKPCKEIENGINWLLKLQNRDGGIPTFCKGWGKLPFDASSPDITAHSIQAMHLWYDVLTIELQNKCKKSIHNMLKWMQSVQSEEGSLIPLWFGDQNSPNESAPVYGTALAVEYLAEVDNKVTQKVVEKGINYLLTAQNEDGGWGGTKEVPSRVTMTARALSALASQGYYDHEKTQAGITYLVNKYNAGELFQKEPIGLYFSRLWYSEEMYNITFVINAMNKLKLIK